MFPSDLIVPTASAYILCVLCFHLMPSKWDADLRSRIFSTINAIVCSVIGVRTLIDRHDQVVSGDARLFTDNTDYWERAVSAWAFGYFCADASLGLLYPGLLDPLMWFHHLTGIFTNGASLVTPPSGSAAPILSVFLSNEISTPFINLHHAFHANGIKDWRRTLNGALCWIFFLLVRIVGNGRFVVGFWRITHSPVGDKLWLTMPVHMTSVVVLLPLVMAMNVWWFYKLTLGLVRAVSGSKGGRARDESTAEKAARSAVHTENSAGTSTEAATPGGSPLGEFMGSELASHSGPAGEVKPGAEGGKDRGQKGARRRLA